MTIQDISRDGNLFDLNRYLFRMAPGLRTPANRQEVTKKPDSAPTVEAERISAVDAMALAMQEGAMGG